MVDKLTTAMCTSAWRSQESAGLLQGASGCLSAPSSTGGRLTQSPCGAAPPLKQNKAKVTGVNHSPRSGHLAPLNGIMEIVCDRQRWQECSRSVLE